MNNNIQPGKLKAHKPTKPRGISRRNFISTVSQAGLSLCIPTPVLNALKNNKVTISIITDLHQDIMHDGLKRMEEFAGNIRATKPDAILQMGDFAYPGDKNKEVIRLFNNAHATRLHVIGNHDLDAGYAREQCIRYWGMPGRYYSQKINGVLVIVLDGNDQGSPKHKGGYPSFIGAEQIQWLQQQLNDTTSPAIIVSHQPLAGEGAVDNAKELQSILSKHREKILLAVNGHTHIDSYIQTGGVHYVHINSASYFWLGGEYKHKSYSEAIHAGHPWIASTCPYEKALFATLIIDPKKKKIIINGQKTNWVGQSPSDLGFSGTEGNFAGIEVVPEIRNRKWTN